MRTPKATIWFRSASILVLAVLGLAQAEEPSFAITRWGNHLIVTAPAGDTGNQALAARLRQRVTVDFKDATIEEVLGLLRQLSQANIVLLPGPATAPVTLKVENMDLGNVLVWVSRLTGLHLGYLHGAICLSDQPIVGDTVTRIYDVSDLVSPVRDFPGPSLAMEAGGARLMPAVADNAETASSVDEIIDLITKQVQADGHK
jgi:hypothetical protein